MSARIRFRQRIDKKICVFYVASARIGLLLISKKKQLISADKKKSEKNKFISGDKKTFSQPCFFCLFFSLPSLTFSQIDQKLFLFRRPH